VSSSRYAVLAQFSLGYSPPEGRLSTCYAPVRHGCIATPVRLACVKHAASVRSEPGSNSHLKLVLRPRRFASARPERTVSTSLGFYSKNPRSEQTDRDKPNGFWLVSSDCQRAGTSWPAGRTADNRQFYPNGPECQGDKSGNSVDGSLKTRKRITRAKVVSSPVPNLGPGHSDGFPKRTGIITNRNRK
jgi:hypothetical protein